MNEIDSPLSNRNITGKILTIRNKQVLLDAHLADLYGIETKYLNRAVKRNPERFPDAFMFQLDQIEFDSLRFQFGTSNSSEAGDPGQTKKRGGRRFLPYAFTEQGVAMLSTVLNSETAIKTSIAIMNAFVEMRHFLLENAELLNRIQRIESKQIETDDKIQKLLSAMESREIKSNQGIFFNGQVFDAWMFAGDMIKSAKFSLELLDNYIDESVLSLFAKKREGVTVTIYTKQISKTLEEDAKRFNKQFGGLTINEFQYSHDRFLIIDNSEVYHIGASIKDLGKRWFAFSKMQKDSVTIIAKLEELKKHL